MYPNVRAEMARQNLTLKAVARELNIRIGTLSGKLNGKYPITLAEAKAIKKVVKTDLPIEELFKTEA